MSDPAVMMLLVALKPGNTNAAERFSTVDLLINAACFVKEVNNIWILKRADLN
jgi:hypothetical protein